MTRTCARCGRTPALGWAQINDDWYCHGDEPGLTCYELGQVSHGAVDPRWTITVISPQPNPNTGEQRQP